MIKKFLLLRDFPLTILPPNPNVPTKAPAPSKNFTKMTERWNQTDLGYFNPYLDKTRRDGEIVLVEKNVYYRNVVFFVQRLQSLVIFKRAALVKANIATSLCGSTLEWYISELSDFDQDELNNNPSIKSWISMLSNCFKVPTSIILSLLTDKTYSLNNVQA